MSEVAPAPATASIKAAKRVSKPKMAGLSVGDLIVKGCVWRFSVFFLSTNFMCRAKPIINSFYLQVLCVYPKPDISYASVP